MGIWTAWELPGFRLLRWLQALIWAFMPGVKDENRQNMVEKEEWEARMRQAETNGRAEMILTRFGDSILRYAYTYLHNMSDAEEVLQDTLVQFLKTAPEFESENHEKSERTADARSIFTQCLRVHSVCCHDLCIPVRKWYSGDRKDRSPELLNRRKVETGQ